MIKSWLQLPKSPLNIADTTSEMYTCVCMKWTNYCFEIMQMWECSKSMKKEYTNQDKSWLQLPKSPLKDAYATSAIPVRMWMRMCQKITFTKTITYRHTEKRPSSWKPSEQPSKEEESYKTTSRSSRVVEKPGIGNEEPPSNGRNTSNHQCRLAAKQLSHWPCKQSSKDSPQGKECLHRRNSIM